MNTTTKTISQSFVKSFIDNDYYMSQDEENSRMGGNEPDDEVAIKHWIRKNANDVIWMLTDHGRTYGPQNKTIGYSRTELAAILTRMVNYILSREWTEDDGSKISGIEFCNSGYPITIKKEFLGL